MVCGKRIESRKGFTLIELLVVIAIIALLVGMLVPTLKTAKELAQAAVCRSHLHQLSVLSMTYVAENNG